VSKISYYQDRWILFKKENTWGVYETPDTFPNYLLEWSATTTENKSEEDIIAGSRDFRKRVWLEEGIVGRWLQELPSARIFQYILGTVATTGTAAPYTSTYSPGSTIPSMSIYRGISPDESGSTVSLGYYGMKVDTAEITIEGGTDLKVEVNFAGKGATVPTKIAAGVPDLDVVAFTFAESSIDLITNDGTSIGLTLSPRLVISVNNNLNARFSAAAADKRAVELREGALEVTGRLTVGGNLGTITSQILDRTDNTIVVYLKKTGSTITTTIRRVSFGELPDELMGMEPVEWELPFVARAATGSDVMTVIEQHTSAIALLPY